MSELIDQLRNLRAAAYRKLTQNSDFKVLLELDEMLGRLDEGDKPMAPPASPQAKTGEDDSEDGEDIEAAPPVPVGEPPPAQEPVREEIQLADEAVVEAQDAGDEGEPDVLVMATAVAEEEPAELLVLEDEPAADSGPGVAEAVAEEIAEAIEASADTAETAEEPAADVIKAARVEQPVVAEEAPDEILADEEAVLAEALAGDMGVVEEPKPSPAPDEADVFSGEETAAAAAVAAALSDSSQTRAPAAKKPAPVNLAPEEDYDAAAPSGTAETSDDAYESALNRLNALIERASTRLKRDDGGEPNGASVA